MGTLFKKKGSKQWQMGVMAGGRQICRSAHTTNKGLATKLLARWERAVYEGRFQLIKTKAPFFEDWAKQFLQTIPNLNTRSRYTASVNNYEAEAREITLIADHCRSHRGL